MSESDSEKVFLSHKGINKDEVKDYQETLKLIGYETWIDEEAMPAGTPLERGLLQGMHDSCGVVFFITPSFNDEGYLETEINHAIAEKRKKNDRFSIITLQFVDAEGNMGEIPELLRTYVWKKPESQLKALQEIIRALPIEPKLVDWRDAVTGVVTTPIADSTATELSVEAKTLLTEAVAGKGRLINGRSFKNATIQANGKNLLPDQSRRTVARWEHGLEQLQRRRYIKGVGEKGEVFEVTHEGYEAAAQMAETDPS